MLNRGRSHYRRKSFEIKSLFDKQVGESTLTGLALNYISFAHPVDIHTLWHSPQVLWHYHSRIQPGTLCTSMPHSHLGMFLTGRWLGRLSRWGSGSQGDMGRQKGSQQSDPLGSSNLKITIHWFSREWVGE